VFTVLVQITFPILAHVAPLWSWSAHERHGRIVSATAAIHQAQKIQPMLRKSGRCLSELSGWVQDPEDKPGVLITWVKDTDTRLTFECNQREKTFWISISYPRDNFGHVEGTFVGPLKINYRQSSSMKNKAISWDENTLGLAELLAGGK
jgi:hypothetical protein